LSRVLTPPVITIFEQVVDNLTGNLICVIIQNDGAIKLRQGIKLTISSRAGNVISENYVAKPNAKPNLAPALA